MILPFNLASAPDICADLGQRCRRLRLLRNISQQALADRVGASLSSVRRFESQGAGSMEMMVRVAQVLFATQALEGLFAEPVQTIAQAEQQLQLQTRQRARRLKPTLTGSAGHQA
jgi:transcriptional regulator with XRE-family HTH domain